jgi:hypothetical protein
LERFGYSVIEAAAGPSALELWRASRDEIDVVVTDVIMPDGMTGVDLARTIEREKENVPIIFISGYNNDLLDVGRDFPEHGAYLPKPFPPLELAQLIRKRLDQRGSPASANN